LSSTLSISLSVNGEMHQALVSGRDTLLTVLRDQLHLTGTKRGCNQGVCGACTVLVNGTAFRSCLSIAALCEKSEITTVEGLNKNGEMAPVQLAFAKLGAVQCGFCTSGMMMAAHAFLAENTNPTVEETQIGLSGNLCRCSGYKKIIDAVIEAGRLTSTGETLR